MRSRVMLEEKESGWIAYLKAEPRIRAEGKTKAEAIGRLYMFHTDLVCFLIIKRWEDQESEGNDE